MIIPARNEAATIGRTVAAVVAQRTPDRQVEIIVVDDGSEDDTAAVAAAAGARVLPLDIARRGNPGAARNVGAASAAGDPLIFLDADCVPAPGWLGALLDAHARGEKIVGGAIDVPGSLRVVARCDHYCGSYHVHPGRAAGYVPNHPPANLSARRDVFAGSCGFSEGHPVADGHEELAWQAALAERGVRIFFEPSAVVLHHNRPGLGNLLRRNFRWGYSALESKHATGAARHSWLYRRPALMVAAAAPLALAHTAYTLGCWARAGRLEPLAMLPLVLAARGAYAAGLVTGGVRWLRRGAGAPGERLEWR